MIQEDVQLKKFNSHVKYVLRKDFYNNKIVEFCALCGSKKYIKYGSYKGIQRYKCNLCNKTFSKSTNSLWSYSKKNPELWINFSELMIEKKSLRFCAEKLNISLVTAFYWRHKILHAMTIDSTPNNLKGVVYMAKAIVPESLKGCKNIKIKNKMDWTKNVWIIGAKGDEDSMFIKPLFRACWDLQLFNEKLYSKIDKKSYIVSYGDRYLEAMATRHNKNRVFQIKDDNRLQHFILNLKNWFEVYHGVATKYLQRYLSFFVLFNLDNKINSMDLIYDNLFYGNRFMRTTEIRCIKNYLY